jgi:hypothetical protein
MRQITGRYYQAQKQAQLITVCSRIAWVTLGSRRPRNVLDAQPPTQPPSGVAVDRPIRFGDGAYFEVVSPSA